MDSSYILAAIPGIIALITALTGIVSNRTKYKREVEKLEVDIQNAKLQAERSEVEALEAKSKAEEAIILSQGGEIRDANEVFLGMFNLINERIKEQEAAGAPPQIHLRLLAVSMTYSWNGFIAAKLPRLLKENPLLKIRVDALIADHEFLMTKKIGQRAIDWAVESELNAKKASSFVKNECPNFNGRLTLNLHAYNNIPHWHGWLINGEHLYLGRTDWEEFGGKPILYVGTNEYRYFDKRDYTGERRIQLFKHWHSFYFNYDSKCVCQYPEPDPNDLAN